MGASSTFYPALSEHFITYAFQCPKRVPLALGMFLKVSFPLLSSKITGSLQACEWLALWHVSPKVLIVLRRIKYFHSCWSWCWIFYCQWKSCPSENIKVELDLKGNKVTENAVYSNHRAIKNDFYSWNKTKTRVKGQLPLLLSESAILCCFSQRIQV